MYLRNRKRYDEIEREVFFVLEECGITKYPIDPIEIARKLNIILIPYSALSPEGKNWAFSKSDDGFCFYEINPQSGIHQDYIYFNDLVYLPRQRWSILHEIGHLVLGHQDMDISYEEAEAEANYFAKYCIAPNPLIDIANCENPWEISDTFCVSFEASCYIFQAFNKWKMFGPPYYTDHELKIINLFTAA